VRPIKQLPIGEQELSIFLSEIRQKLDQGLSSAAEKILIETLTKYLHTDERRAELTQLLSYIFETQGRYRESLETIEKYDDETLLSESVWKGR
jgi:predicted DNA-binding protein (UPF0278 family)